MVDALTRECCRYSDQQSGSGSCGVRFAASPLLASEHTVSVGGGACGHSAKDIGRIAGNSRSVSGHTGLALRDDDFRVADISLSGLHALDLGWGHNNVELRCMERGSVVIVRRVRCSMGRSIHLLTSQPGPA